VRKALLFLILALVSCAPRVPVSFVPPPRSLPPALQGQAGFELRYPGGKEKGRLFYLIGRQGIYAESISPFGWSLFQALLKQETVTLVIVPRREIILFYLHTPPPSLRENWGALFLGAIPENWKVEAAYRRGDLIEVHFALEDGFRARGLFGPKQRLRELTLEHGRELARFRYLPQETWLEIPPLHSQLKVRFITQQTLEEEKPLFLDLPAGFRTKIYDLSL